MGALTEDRKTQMRDGELLSMRVAAGVKIFSGSIVARNESGYATPGGLGDNMQGIGRAENQIDNTSGKDGDLSLAVRKGVFCFANDGSITISDIGYNCYMVDDQTVSSARDNNSDSVAGLVFDVDNDGVWVRFV